MDLKVRFFPEQQVVTTDLDLCFGSRGESFHVGNRQKQRNNMSSSLNNFKVHLS